MIPKGWPIAGLSPSRSAAREAFEEAGVKGRTVAPALGDYHYRKRLGGGAERDCRVDVFALSVEKQCEKWPEQAERITRWFPAGEAAQAVNEPDLAALIRCFAAGLYRRYA